MNRKRRPGENHGAIRRKSLLPLYIDVRVNTDKYRNLRGKTLRPAVAEVVSEDFGWTIDLYSRHIGGVSGSLTPRSVLGSVLRILSSAA